MADFDLKVVVKELPIDIVFENTGQIPNVPQNPRRISEEAFELLKKSINDSPEMKNLDEIKVFPLNGQYIAISGNHRLRAYKELDWKNVLCKVLPENTPTEKLQEYIMKENMQYADNDLHLLEEWDKEKLEDCGVKTLDDWEEYHTTPQSFGTGKDRAGNLKDRFVVPPFSIIDSRQGYWQERKRLWKAITGNLSETRDGEFGKVGGASSPNTYTTINAGTSNFDPVFAEIMFKWFCPKGGSVLDPFGGEQTKGIVAGELGFKYEGVEIREDQVKLNTALTKKYKGVKYVCGDSNNISNLIKKRDFDFVFTSPPYYDLEVYSKNDLSALGSYREFMKQYENIFRQCVEMMKEDSFLVLKVSEIRDKKTGIYRNFVGDNISLFRKLGLHYYNELIIINAVGTAALRVNHYFKNRKIVRLHQNVLVFYKGNVQNIAKKFQQLDYTDEELISFGLNNEEGNRVVEEG